MGPRSEEVSEKGLRRTHSVLFSITAISARIAIYRAQNRYIGDKKTALAQSIPVLLPPSGVAVLCPVQLKPRPRPPPRDSSSPSRHVDACAGDDGRCGSESWPAGQAGRPGQLKPRPRPPPRDSSSLSRHVGARLRRPWRWILISVVVQQRGLASHKLGHNESTFVCLASQAHGRPPPLALQGRRRCAAAAPASRAHTRRCARQSAVAHAAPQ